MARLAAPRVQCGACDPETNVASESFQREVRSQVTLEGRWVGGGKSWGGASKDGIFQAKGMARIRNNYYNPQNRDLRTFACLPPSQVGIIICSILQMRTLSTEQLNNVPKVTELASGRARI